MSFNSHHRRGAAAHWCVTLVAIAGLWLSAARVATQRKPVAVEDAIEMRRIQGIPSQNEEIGQFSPDGTRFVSVVWRGDLARNVNLYSMLLFDLRQKKVVPRTLLTWEFTSVQRNQHASPFSRISFLPDNRTLAFLGNKRGEVPQVHALNTESGQLRRLTDHPTAVLSYALSPRGQVRVFSAAAQTDGSEWLPLAPSRRQPGATVQIVRGTSARDERRLDRTYRPGDETGSAAHHRTG